MFDFLKVSKVWDNKKQRYIYTPRFIIKPVLKDLMIRARDFYAIFNESTGLWETNEATAISMIDDQVRAYALKDAGNEIYDDAHGPLVKLISDTENRLIAQWHQYCQKDMRDTWEPLNQKVIFSNQTPVRSDHASKKLDYPLMEGATPAYDKCCSVWYLPEEQQKWEWYVGCILAGDATKIQKAIIFYGEPGTGKSSIAQLWIGEGVFGGSSASGGFAGNFDATALAESKDNFGTDFLTDDPVVAIDGEAKMSVINARGTFNKIISHEPVRVNAKFKSPYYVKPSTLLIMCANDPVQISPNSGLRRRIIDIQPTGNTLTPTDYDWCMSQIPFERAGVAFKCLQTYKKLGKHYYDHYISEDMMNRTSPFQNFVVENYLELKDGISLAAAYKLYTQYAEESNFKNILVRYKFRDTLKLYFNSYKDGKFSGFKEEKIGLKDVTKNDEEMNDIWLRFDKKESLFDTQFKNALAQYEQENDDHPLKYKWTDCKTRLSDLDTSKIHYVKIPENLIVIDFDIKGGDGKKSLEKNIKEASKFPPTYAELSKSGQGIHLHYWYTGGNPTKLSRIYAPNIEIKVFSGGSSLRRKLTYCNDIPIAEMSSGLPLQEDKEVVNEEGFENQAKLVRVIRKATTVEKLPDGSKKIGYWEKGLTSTRQNIDLIEKCLKEAYASGKTYDVRDLKNRCTDFALQSSNHAQYCFERVSNMLFCSKDILDAEKEKGTVEDHASEAYNSLPIAFFDCEIFPSYRQAKENGVDVSDIPEDTPALFVICWKLQGIDAKVNIMINPKPEEVKQLWTLYRLIGFNNVNYDNHMLWARALGYSIEDLYKLSGRLINDNPEVSRKAKFWEARNVSYTDIRDFMSAPNKQVGGLKKWEIKLHIHHQEWNKPWYLPVPVKDWMKVADYCCNDVVSTEAVFNYKTVHADFIAREILADISGGTPNMTTNQLTLKLIFGENKHPGLIYTDFKTGKQYGPHEDPPKYIQDVIDDLGGPYIPMGKTN